MMTTMETMVMSRDSVEREKQNSISCENLNSPSFQTL
jgi:hypothetical protein